ncbi:FHA domain-containing protein [Urbifossiella limnaea]|uniref:FHA domain protein n=1 Tax=Urbifossiella limnaea TaxID=2528023 RepID=A0A517XVV7_9BACT|nr:FHA domain-containing protein [Urbifossiella limnaea]QDU21652.1 FHA domain protein [Urbifossiella limnaea]
MRARLVPADGGPPIDLTKDLSVVGRGADCDVRVEHKSVSKYHCVVVKTDGLLLLRDLGSTNGTRVNGQRVRRAALLPNDSVGFANLKYRVLFGADLDAALAAEAAAGSSAAPVRRNALPDVYEEQHTPTD